MEVRQVEAEVVEEVPGVVTVGVVIPKVVVV